jgi:hypothetical protein
LVEPIVNLILLALGDTHFEKYRWAYSDFKYNENSTQKYALLLGKYFFKTKLAAFLKTIYYKNN